MHLELATAFPVSITEEGGAAYVLVVDEARADIGDLVLIHTPDGDIEGMFVEDVEEYRLGEVPQDIMDLFDFLHPNEFYKEVLNSYGDVSMISPVTMYFVTDSLFDDGRDNEELLETWE